MRPFSGKAGVSMPTCSYLFLGGHRPSSRRHRGPGRVLIALRKELVPGSFFHPELRLPGVCSSQQRCPPFPREARPAVPEQ